MNITAADSLDSEAVKTNLEGRLQEHGVAGSEVQVLIGRYHLSELGVEHAWIAKVSSALDNDYGKPDSTVVPTRQF